MYIRIAFYIELRLRVSRLLRSIANYTYEIVYKKSNCESLSKNCYNYLKFLELDAFLHYIMGLKE